MLFTPEEQNKLIPAIKTDSAIFSLAEKPLTESVTRAHSLDPVNRVSYLEARVICSTHCYGIRTP